MTSDVLPAPPAPAAGAAPDDETAACSPTPLADPQDHGSDDRAGPASDGERASMSADHCVLLVIDMISRWDFPDAAPMRDAAARITPAVARLKRRCRALGIPTIYANDNQGRWRSDWRALMRDALAAGRVDGTASGDAARDGRWIATQLAPQPDDYFILKPKHSAFFATPLALLLQHLRRRHLLLAGVSSDQCVLSTAHDARMQDFDVTVPHDAVIAPTRDRSEAARRHFDEVLGVDTTAVDLLRWPETGTDGPPEPRTPSPQPERR